MIRRQALEAEIARALPDSPWAETASRLVCMRGIDTLTAAAFCVIPDSIACTRASLPAGPRAALP